MARQILLTTLAITRKLFSSNNEASLLTRLRRKKWALPMHLKESATYIVREENTARLWRAISRAWPFRNRLKLHSPLPSEALDWLGLCRVIFLQRLSTTARP